MISKVFSVQIICLFAMALCLVQQVTICDAEPEVISELRYEPMGPLRINMGSTYEVTAKIQLNGTAIPAKRADEIIITFQTNTISPPFHILGLDPNSYRVVINRQSLNASKYLVSAKLKLSANYIGHAILEPISIAFTDLKSTRTVGRIISNKAFQLPIIIVQNEGIWGQIFIFSVIILMIISYINLGAQLDEENMRQVIKRPMTLIFGFLISVLVMPTLSWFVGKLLFPNQTLYRIGSFVFACTPAASSSTLWTVMLNSDKELSVGLQVLSNIGAIFTMPLLLYAMEQSLKSESTHHINIVPYGRLLQALFVLLIALLIGWRFVGRNESAQKLSRKIFRPLVFFVLIFIIVFSSALYWHIYQMFTWTIMLASFLIATITYVLSGLLGYLLSGFNYDKAVAISIGSAYKNSGISFAALLVAFGAPDTYIAFVPSLNQTIITSLLVYLIYAFQKLCSCIHKRNGRTVSTEDVEISVDKSASQRRRNSDRDSNPASCSGAEVEENDEFIAMNVTDIEPEVLGAQVKKQSFDAAAAAGGQATEVKVVIPQNSNDTQVPATASKLVTNV